MAGAVERYRDPETTWDEDSSGENVTYPEYFTICVDCGVAVYDQEAHDKHHEELRKILAALKP